MHSPFNIQQSAFSCWLGRWALLLLAVMLGGLCLFCAGDQMRESDQASILTGALDIAWGGDIVGNSAYRYDKFYGTYWILGLLYQCLGWEPGVDSSLVVGAGNILAALWYSVTLVCLLAFTKSRLITFVVVSVAITSPVMLFSSFLVSPNVFSVGWLFVLLHCLRRSSVKNENLGWELAVFVSTFMAVACRLDAVLVLPAFCLLSNRGSSWKSLLKRRVYWVAFVGAVLALLVSRLVGGGHSSGIGESFFFQFKIAAAYLSFGLGVSLLMLGLICLYLLSRKRSFSVFIGLLLLAPLGFYLGLLFTPRHLMLVPVVLLASALLPRGRFYWNQLVRIKTVKLAIYGAGLLAFLMLFVGLRLPSLKSPRLSLSDTSLYPTADGYWPMSGTFPFLSRLKNASEIPVDHNQEVWASWQKYDFSRADQVYWDGLFRYPELVAKCQGHEIHFSKKTENVVVSERVIRRAGGSGGSIVIRKKLFDSVRSGVVPSIGEGDALGLINLTGSESGSKEMVARYLAAELCEGNDFMWCSLEPRLFEKKVAYLGDGPCYLISVAGELEGLQEGRQVGDLWVYSTRDWQAVKKRSGVFLASVRLASYMHVKKYE